MSAFLVTFSGDVHNVERIGGAKAVEDGFLLLGIGQDDILEWIEVPTPVAVAWRDGVAALLSSYRPKRPLKQLEWLRIAAGVDPAWAATQGWQTAEAAPAVAPAAAGSSSPPAVSATPLVRRVADRAPPPPAAE